MEVVEIKQKTCPQVLFLGELKDFPMRNTPGKEVKFAQIGDFPYFPFSVGHLLPRSSGPELNLHHSPRMMFSNIYYTEVHT